MTKLYTAITKQYPTMGSHKNKVAELLQSKANDLLNSQTHIASMFDWRIYITRPNNNTLMLEKFSENGFLQQTITIRTRAKTIDGLAIAILRILKLYRQL